MPYTLVVYFLIIVMRDKGFFGDEVAWELSVLNIIGNTRAITLN
jgi:hypothetical protein